MRGIRSLIILLLAIVALPCFSQDLKARMDSHTVRGIVIDTVSETKKTNAAVVVLDSKDSIIVDFTRVSANGDFVISGLKSGSYVLLVSYPSYADYSEVFILDSTKREHDFGVIKLIQKSNLLREVIIKGAISKIKIKGDTIEYNASSFQMNPNDKVEDLLKRLPGIQVDKDGRITARSEVINKVLVDGEEFFGDDPTLVTKNIRADMVDKVQVYDKKSDQATFTGIDDGKKTKTINIKLKEDKKNGSFGKINAGIGTNKIYTGQVYLNVFKSKQKLSLYGIIGTDGKTSLDWQDNAKYASSNVDMSNQGMIIDLGSDDELSTFSGRYDGRGSPFARTGGIHYDAKSDDDKQSINANYKVGALTVDVNNHTELQNNLPQGYVMTTSNQNLHNYIFRQKADAIYQLKLDTSSNLKMSINATAKTLQTTNNYFSKSFSNDNFLLNDNNTDLSNNGSQKILNLEALYTKKFKKPGRTGSVYLMNAINNTNSTGFLNSKINFYDNIGQIDSIERTDQYKETNLQNSAFNANFTYSEPIAKYFSVMLNYKFGINNSNSNKESFDKSVDGQYNLLNSLYSNDFKLKQLTNQFGTALGYAKGKMVFNLSTKATTADFEQLDKYTGKVFKRNFLLWNLQTVYQYKIAQQSSIRFQYTGNSTEPTVAQLQPVLINVDPLNVIAGNPNLNPSFSNVFHFNFQAINPKNGRLINVIVNYSLLNNAIVSNLVTNPLGKSTTQYINLTGHSLSNTRVGLFYNRKVNFLDLDAGFNASVDGNTTYTLSNDAINKIKFYVYNFQAAISKTVSNKYEFNLTFGPNYTTSNSSLQTGVNNNGIGFTGNSDLSIYLPGKFRINTSANYQYNAKTQTFNQDFSRMILNTALIKTFSKSEALKLSVSVNDLLNQNSGFNRTVNNNFITQNSYSTIKRYFMISLIYDFTKVSETSKSN